VVIVECANCGKRYPETANRANDPNRRNYCGRACYAEGRKKFCRRPVADRFWEKVQKTDDCWNWIGQLDRKGYGTLGSGGREGRMTHAHRIAWAILIGDIPDRMNVLHKCDNRRCVNPDHLFLGTNADNMKDKIAKGRQTRGSNCPSAKLTEEKVIEIRRRYAAGEMDQAALAWEYGVGLATICEAISGKTWGHVPPTTQG
jgi:hypothetical protein